MKLRTRIIILIILGCLFFVSAPLTLLLSLGYRYNFSQNRLQSTGTLVIESQPRGATILLNKKPIDSTTPATIRYLLPAEYDVRLEKEGYQPWEKRFSIIEGRLTTAHADGQPITLFLSRPLQKLLSKNALDVFQTQNAIVSTATSTITFKDTQTQTTIPTTIPYDPHSPPVTTVSGDKQWLVTTSGGRVYITSLNSLQTTDLTAVAPDVERVETPGAETLLLLTKEKRLYQYSPQTRTLRLRKKNVSAVSAGTAGQFYFIHNGRLMSSNSASSTLETISTLPAGVTSASLLTTPTGQLFALLDKKLFYTSKNFELLASDIAGASWEAEAGKLLFWTNNSISVFDPQSGQQPEVIVRSSSSIRNPVLNAGAGAIFYLENNTLKAIELQAVVRRVITNLITFDTTPTKFLIDREGKIIYSLIPGHGLFTARIR